MINGDMKPPIKSPTKIPACLNNKSIPPERPFPIIPPSGPTAMSIIGTTTRSVTVGTRMIFNDFGLYFSANLSTYEPSQMVSRIGITDEEYTTETTGKPRNSVFPAPSKAVNCGCSAAAAMAAAIY